jgi:hypothetical protein
MAAEVTKVAATEAAQQFEINNDSARYGALTVGGGLVFSIVVG